MHFTHYYECSFDFLSARCCGNVSDADRWDRNGNKAQRNERVAAYVTAVDNGEADAIKPLVLKVKALKKAHKHVVHAVHTCKSTKKDPLSPAMAEFLSNTTSLEKLFKLIVATKDEGDEYTRSEIVAFARTADELVRSATSILRGEWQPGRASALRIRQVRDSKDGKLKREQWIAHLTPVYHNTEEYQQVMNDEDLLRVSKQWCELLTTEKGLCLQYRTNQKGASDGEVLKVVTYPIPNYKGSPPASADSIFGPVDKKGRRSRSGSPTSTSRGKSPKGEKEFGEVVHDNPLSTGSDSNPDGSQDDFGEMTPTQQSLEQPPDKKRQIVSFSIGVRELQDDGDVDTEDLVCKYETTACV